MADVARYVQMFTYLLLQALYWAIIIRAILSWFPIGRENRLMQLLLEVTEPVLAPFRRVIPQIGMFDLSALAAILVLGFLSEAVSRGTFF